MSLGSFSHHIVLQRHNNMMSLGQPESVKLARSEDSFSDDGRSEPSFGSLQELEYVDRWPERGGRHRVMTNRARTPRIGPALSLDEDDDDARVVETVDLDDAAAAAARSGSPARPGARVHAVTPPAGPDAVAPFTFCSALNLGDFAAPMAGSPARSVPRAGSVVGRGDADKRRDARHAGVAGRRGPAQFPAAPQRVVVRGVAREV